MLKNKHTALRVYLFFTCIFACAFNVLNAQTTDKVMHPTPVISWDLTGLCLGDTTFFINKTTGEVTDSWTIYEVTSFGEVLIKQDSSYNTKFLFPHPATYRVQLDADNGHLTTLSRYLTVDSIPYSWFDYQDCNSQFTNLSCCATSSFWDFGDGFTSTQKSPVHFFQTTGTKTVKLKITSGTKVDSLEQDINICCVNGFLGTFKYTIGPDSVYFTAEDSTGGFYVQYHWAFGDGSVADLNGINGGKKLYHTYPKTDSTYYVFLLVKTFCSFAYSQQVIQIGNGTSSPHPTMFPNPLTNDNYIFINKADRIDLNNFSIYSLLGQKMGGIIIDETSSGYKIYLHDPAPGCYIIRYDKNGETISTKLIKQ